MPVSCGQELDLKFENKRQKINQIIDMQRKKTGKLFNFCLQSTVIIAKKNKKEKNFFGKLIEWKKLNDLIPKNFMKESRYKTTGKAGIFAGSLELVKEGSLQLRQDNFNDKILLHPKIN